jgi:hypothetical protein
MADLVHALRRLLKEPLLHFLLLGAAIFVAHSLITNRSSAEPGKIVITQRQVENLAFGFAKTWQRPPTEQELAGLVHDRVREEVYYREAMALGMDKDDTVIRRRLRQKMEFVSDDLAAQAEPTDADLNAYLKAHADKFPVEQRFTFRHVYLNPDKHRANLAGDTAQLLAELKKSGDKADISALGDVFLLEHDFTALPASEVAKQFGAQFAAKLGELSPGQWQGPVESGYGVHLVRVSERSEGRLPALADVRVAVRREWDNDRRRQANEKFFQDLLKRYVVTVEQPKLAQDQPGTTKTQ